VQRRLSARSARRLDPTAKATLTPSAKRTAVVNPALASWAATSNGQSATVVTAVPALLAALATFQQVALI
jgi:hypothetical protein